MSRTLAEIVIAIIVVILFFRLGIQIAPIILDWWQDLRNSVSNNERNDHDDHK